MVKIQLIIASTRPNRFGPQPAQWLFELAKTRTDAEFELIDLKELNLPLFDEPNVPASGIYIQEHTKKWSEIIVSGDGFVFITPEYNYSYPASLKNALDFLWHEWNYKPAAFVGYGSVGGARALEHLHALVTPLKMYALRDEVRIENPTQYKDEQGNFVAADAHIQAAHGMLDQLVFWAEHMKAARADLAAK